MKSILFVFGFVMFCEAAWACEDISDADMVTCRGYETRWEIDRFQMGASKDIIGDYQKLENHRAMNIEVRSGNKVLAEKKYQNELESSEPAFVRGATCQLQSQIAIYQLPVTIRLQKGDLKCAEELEAFCDKQLRDAPYENFEGNLTGKEIIICP